MLGDYLGKGFSPVGRKPLVLCTLSTVACYLYWSAFLLVTMANKRVLVNSPLFNQQWWAHRKWIWSKHVKVIVFRVTVSNSRMLNQSVIHGQYLDALIFEFKLNLLWQLGRTACVFLYLVSKCCTISNGSLVCSIKSFKKMFPWSTTSFKEPILVHKSCQTRVSKIQFVGWLSKANASCW